MYTYPYYYRPNYYKQRTYNYPNRQGGFVLPFALGFLSASLVLRPNYYPNYYYPNYYPNYYPYYPR